MGGGIVAAGAHGELRKVAETFNIPVTTTLLGVGAFPDRHPLSLKWLGMHGAYYANCAANECDLLLCVGARFDDRVTGDVDLFARHATIIHVDIDPSEINKNKRADIGIVSDAKTFLSKLLEEPISKEYAAWHAQIGEWKREYPFSYQLDETTIQPQYVIERLCELTDGKALIVTGVGQHQMWAAQFYQFERPRQLLTSGGLGAMGFGLPAAIGAKLGCPDQEVVCIDGDGSFQMNIQELGTAFAEEVPVKVVILNNQHLGMVAQWEDRFYGSRRGDTVLSNPKVDRPYPNFIEIAKGFYVPGREVRQRGDLDAALREMLAANGPYVLDIHTGYQEHVLPMIPSGKTYLESILE